MPPAAMQPVCQSNAPACACATPASAKITEAFRRDEPQFSPVQRDDSESRSAAQPLSKTGDTFPAQRARSAGKRHRRAAHAAARDEFLKDQAVLEMLRVDVRLVCRAVTICSRLAIEKKRRGGAQLTAHQGPRVTPGAVALDAAAGIGQKPLRVEISALVFCDLRKLDGFCITGRVDNRLGTLAHDLASDIKVRSAAQKA